MLLLEDIFNVVIWYRESFINLGECVISCNCYLIWRILYPRKGKCDQWQNCYQLQHPHLIWRIHLSDPQFKPFNLDMFNIFFVLTWWICGIFLSLESNLKIHMIYRWKHATCVANICEKPGILKCTNEKHNGCFGDWQMTNVTACSQAGHLRKHLKMHSGEKSNKCNQCDFASSHAGHLGTHLKMHSGEKPNKCSQCNYASCHRIPV